MKTLLVVTLTHVLLKLVDPVPLASFYTFGPIAGDTSLPRDDNEYLPLISLSTTFPTLEPKRCVMITKCFMYKATKLIYIVGIV